MEVLDVVSKPHKRATKERPFDHEEKKQVIESNDKKTQKRAMAGGKGLRLMNANKHIRDIFKYAGFDRIFEIAPAGG